MISDERKDVLVVHIKNNRTEKVDLRDVDNAGTAFPYQGATYFSGRGRRETWPLLRKWEGTNFVKVDRERSLAIMNSFKLFETVIKAEGWKETRIHLDVNGASMPFPLWFWPLSLNPHAAINERAHGQFN